MIALLLAAAILAGGQGPARVPDREAHVIAMRALARAAIERDPEFNRAGQEALRRAVQVSGDQRERRLNDVIATHSDAWFENGVQVGAQDLDEQELSELRRCELRARQAGGPLLDEPVEEPSEDRRLRGCRLDVNPRRQNIRQQSPARRIQQDMAADMSEVTAVTEPGRRPAGAGEQAHGVDRGDLQVAGQYERPLRRQQTHVSSGEMQRFLLTVDADPALALHDRKELDLVGRRKPDCPGTSGGEPTRHDGLRLRELEDVGERIGAHFRTFAQVTRTFKHSQSGHPAVPSHRRDRSAATPRRA